MEKEEEIMQKLVEQDEKLEKILKSAEKTRRMILWRTIASVILFVLPLLGLAFIVPWFLGVMSNAYKGLL